MRAFRRSVRKIDRCVLPRPKIACAVPPIWRFINFGIVEEFPARQSNSSPQRTQYSEGKWNGAWNTMDPDRRSEWFLGSLAVVVVQQPTDAFPPLYFANAACMLRLGTDQCVVQTLVVALTMVMHHEFNSRFPHRALTEQDHPV